MPRSDTVTTARDRNPAINANSTAATPRQSLRRSFKGLRVFFHPNNIACSSRRLAVPSVGQLTRAGGGARRHGESCVRASAIGQDTARGAIHDDMVNDQHKAGLAIARTGWTLMPFFRARNVETSKADAAFEMLPSSLRSGLGIVEARAFAQRPQSRLKAN